MTVQQQTNSSSESALLRTLVVLAERRRIIVLGVALAATLTALIVLVMPVTYTATAVILPPQTGSGAAALLSQLGSLGSLGSVASMGTEGTELKSPADTFLGVLSSRTVADELINRYHLQSVYKKRTLVDTRKSLAKHTHIELTRGSLIQISVDDHNVQRAVDLANGFVDELYRVNEDLALTSGSQKRLFMEQQLNAERTALAKAEADFQEIQKKTGVIQLAGQAEITLRSIAQIRATIAAKEVQVELLRKTATEQNPEVQALESEIGALHGQLSKAESDSAGSEDNYFVSAGRIPTAGLEYLRRTRELRYHETLFEMLARQYEAARLEEAKSPPVIQVVDRAIPPDKRSWPPRTLLVLLSALIAGILLCGGVLLHNRWMHLTSEPVNAAHVSALREMLSLNHRFASHPPRARPSAGDQQ
jgi:tyrosine-protein kinase Etk/Wzc